MAKGKNKDYTKGGPNTSAQKDRRGNKRGSQKSVLGTPFREDQRGNRNQRRAEEVADTVVKMSKSNPLNLYTKFTQFSTDAATVAFARPLGTPFLPLKGTGANYAVPGVMRIVFTPTVGVSKDYTSPINRSSTRFYTYLRSNQKASALYDHQDITMMELSMDSLYMFHSHLRRIYGVMNNVSPVNEYYARSLVASLGASYNDVRQHMQDFRGYINTLAYNLGQFALPKGITLFDRHTWMCEGYYLDSQTTRAQTYVFVPQGFWKYDNTVETGSQLTFKYFLSNTPTDNTQYTVAQLMAFGDELLNAVSGDEDFQYISGDIYNFYGGDTYTLPYVEEGYRVMPVYDKVVLSQIENAVICGQYSTDPVITQNPSVNQGAIIFTPSFIQKNLVAYPATQMNFHWDSPTPADVIEASRLTPVVHIVPGKAGINTLQVDACGTELVNRVDIFGINPTSLAPRSNPITTRLYNAPTTGELMDVLHLAQFDWAPLLIVEASGLDVTTITGYTWDLDVFDLVPDNYMATIHDACLYSLFEVGTNAVTVTG